MWNILDQLLVAVKVKHIANLIIEDLKNGKKPVISLSSTMESIFDQMYEDGLIEKGDLVSLDFSYILGRAVKSTMKYTIKTSQGIGNKKALDVNDLTEDGRAAYIRLMNQISELTTGVPISPIDVLKKIVTDAGYDVVEVTGRKTMFELNDDMTKGKYLNNDRPDKRGAISRFNNNPGVVAIINRAGATGVSMHSSPRFNDTSPRVMYFLQNEFDINTVVQKYGRIYRSDQVNKPEYNFLISPVPAEVRNMMMLARKLKSLDANTTGNQSHSKNMMDIPDFLNKYGDEVVVEYLRENTDINDMLGDPLKLGEEDEAVENAAYKITGKMQILPSDLQEKAYEEIVSRYNDYIEYLNATGQNDLKVESIDLKATFKNSEVTIFGNGGFSAFGENTILNTAEVNITRKPLKQKELKEMIQRVPENHSQDMKEKMKGDMEKMLGEERKAIADRYEKMRATKKEKIWEKKALSLSEKQQLYDIEVRKINEEESNRIQVLESNYETRMGILRRYMDFFYPGRVLEVPFQEKEQLALIRMNKGVFISFDVNMKKKNPWALSNVMLKFATLDSRRVFRIPASKMSHIDAIIGNSYNMPESEMVEVIERWDYLKPAKDRGIRFIVTGNILQGMNVYRGGKLIQFTKDDGDIDVGIMMPENWIKPDTKNIKIPISRAYDIIINLRPGESITDADGIFTIRRMPSYEEDAFEIIVPDNARKGKQFYQNERIMQLVVAGRFDKRGNNQVAIIKRPFVKPLIEYLNERFSMQIEADNNQAGRAMNQTQHQDMMDEHGIEYRERKRGPGRSQEEENHVDKVSGKTGRVRWGAIPGTKPKKLSVIIGELSKALGKDILYVKRPGQGTRLAGAYQPGSGKVAVKHGYTMDMDVLIHEIGHFLDDKLGILGPQSFHLWGQMKPELSQLWKFGSKPPKNSADPEKYKMAEGMAEFIRAWTVNPVETESRFPITYQWFKTVVEPHQKIWNALKQFSEDIRAFMGSTALDQMASTLAIDIDTQKKPMAFHRTNKEGQYQITVFDKVARDIYYFLDPLVEAYKYAMRQHGITDIHDPTQLSRS